MKNTKPTPYPELNQVLQELVESVQAILGDNFVGAYLQGSFSVGDFDEHSDVDWAIVIEKALSEAQVAALQVMHERIYNLESKRAGAEWAKRNLDPSWSGLIDRAWNGRPNPAVSLRQPADPQDYAATLKFVQCIIDESKKLRAEGW